MDIKARLISVLVGSVFFACGVGVLLGMSLPTLELSRSGVSTTGLVEKLVEYRYLPQGGESKYHVYYVFALPGGEQIHGHTQLSAASWSSLRKGQTVTVRYRSSNPGTNLLADYPQWWVGYLVMITFPPIFRGVGLRLILDGVAPGIAAKISAVFNDYRDQR